MYQVCYTRYHVSFYLWLIGSVLKHCKVPKYYEQDCSFRYHKIFYRDFVNELQINTAKSTYEHTTTQVLIRPFQLYSEDHIKEGEQGGRGEKGDRKNAKTGNKSNINLKLSNFRNHGNYFREFSNKLQINPAKNTCDQTSSDNASVTARLVKEVLSILTSE